MSNLVCRTCGQQKKKPPKPRLRVHLSDYISGNGISPHQRYIYILERASLTSTGYTSIMRAIGEAPCYEESILDVDDLKRAVRRRWRNAAEKGCKVARCNLGFAHSLGIGVPQDDKLAVQYWEHSAKAGNAIAMYELACSYRWGRGVARDPAESIVWLKGAAERGLLRAMTALGNCYERGIELQKDQSQSTMWWRKARNQTNEYIEQTNGTKKINDKTRIPEFETPLVVMTDMPERIIYVFQCDNTFGGVDENSNQQPEVLTADQSLTKKRSRDAEMDGNDIEGGRLVKKRAHLPSTEDCSGLDVLWGAIVTEEKEEEEEEKRKGNHLGNVNEPLGNVSPVVFPSPTTKKTNKARSSVCNQGSQQQQQQQQQRPVRMFHMKLRSQQTIHKM